MCKQWNAFQSHTTWDIVRSVIRLVRRSGADWDGCDQCGGLSFPRLLEKPSIWNLLLMPCYIRFLEGTANPALVWSPVWSMTCRNSNPEKWTGTSATCNSSLPLRIDGLVKRFGRVNAVDGITLELRNGECLGLLGPNGAGKSTLIRSIVGRVVPDRGTISIFGAKTNSIAARSMLGWVPQELALYPRLTCCENVRAFGRYHGLRGIALEQAVVRCLDWSTLADRAHDLVKNLSGGMKRRLWQPASFNSRSWF